MSKKLAVFILVVLIVLVGAGMRVHGARWGLPNDLHYFSYHPDETITLLAATEVNFFTGQLDPGFYNYGSLYIYLVNIGILAATVSGLVDVPQDVFSRTDQFANLYLAGRGVALLLGVLTVLLVYFLGRRAYGRGTGLFACLFLALMPLHVMHSRFLAVDVPAAFFVTVSLLFAVRITQGNRLRDYLLAGLFAGLAAGTKYNAGLVIAAPIVAHIASHPSSPLARIVHWRLWLIPILAAVGFLIGTPGALLNTGKFLHDFTYEMTHAATGHGFVFQQTPIGYIYHVTDSLFAGMGLPLLVLAGIGLLHALLRRSAADLTLLSFVIVYFAVIGAAEVKFARYTIPLLPVLAVLAARPLAGLIGWLWGGRFLPKAAACAVGIVALAVVGYTAAYSLVLDEAFVRADTRDQAVKWFRGNVPTGSSVGLATIPWFYTPPLDPCMGHPDLTERCETVRQFTDYPIVVSEMSEWNSEFLRQTAPQYVILSEFEYKDRLRIHDRATREYFGVLARDYDLAHSFRSRLERYAEWFPVKRLPHDMSYASPEIRVYSRKMLE